MILSSSDHETVLVFPFIVLSVGIEVWWSWKVFVTSGPGLTQFSTVSLLVNSKNIADMSS